MSQPNLPPGRRVIIDAFGESPLEALAAHARLEEMPAPDVSALGPRDVLISVRSAAVGWVDLLMTSGQYQHMPKPPYCPGLESAGVIEWLGAEAAQAGLAPGDAVLLDGMLTGPRSLGDYQAYGGYASYAVAPIEAVHRIPGKLSFDQACNLLGNYETAYHCLIARGRLRAGETVSDPRRVWRHRAGRGAGGEAARRHRHRHRSLRGEAGAGEGAGRRSRAPLAGAGRRGRAPLP